MIRTVAETGSTNADLLAEAAAGAPEGIWLRAERQVDGRGRLGRVWESPPGNLYASTVVRLRSGDPEPASLALVTSIALCETARAWAGAGAVPFALKWPNDLMAGPAKVAGILLERVGDAVVIGCGVNLAHRPEGLERPTASFASLGLAPPDPAVFLDDLVAAFARALQQWRDQGLAAVRRHWLTLAHPIGAPIATGGEQGLFDGLDPDGGLRLRRADGTVTIIHAGDVALL